MKPLRVLQVLSPLNFDQAIATLGVSAMGCSVTLPSDFSGSLHFYQEFLSLDR
jgi:hypothetical protein